MGVAPEASLCWFTCTGLAQTINKAMAPSWTRKHFSFAALICALAVQSSRFQFRGFEVAGSLRAPGPSRDIYHYRASGLPDKSSQDFSQAAAHQRCCDSSCLKDNTFYTLIRWLFDLGVLHGRDEN